MPFVTLSQAVAAGLFQNIRLVATDMDGTLTCGGKFTPGLLESLQDLAAVGIGVLVVTGRSAGWVSGISALMPVVGAIAENGGVFFPPGGEWPVVLGPVPDLLGSLGLHRQQLALAFKHLQSIFPTIKESGDNRFRLTDWTFDVAGLTTTDLDNMNYLCYEIGWGFTYSSVQCHIKPQGQDKAAGLRQVLDKFFPELSPNEVITVGDSPNDESLFNSALFPVSVGVANVLEYADRLIYPPAFVTTAAEGEGFCELARCLVKAKR